MSRPPELPGSQRLKRAAASAGSSAYQGVFEAVGAILIAFAAGFWLGRYFETAPVGLLVGVVIGFGAFVLRMIRLGKELHPDSEKGQRAAGVMDASFVASEAPLDSDLGDDRGFGEAPGMSDVLRDDSKESSDE